MTCQQPLSRLTVGLDTTGRCSLITSQRRQMASLSAVTPLLDAADSRVIMSVKLKTLRSCYKTLVGQTKLSSGVIPQKFSPKQHLPVLKESPSLLPTPINCLTQI